MADTDDESALFAQQKKDLKELYPTDEAWDRSYPDTGPPDDPMLRRQYDDLMQMRPQVDKALHHTETSTDIAAKRQDELTLHDRIVSRSAINAARHALHDNGPGKDPGTYTTYEARDRAAHTPAVTRIEPEK